MGGPIQSMKGLRAKAEASSRIHSAPRIPHTNLAWEPLLSPSLACRLQCQDHTIDSHWLPGLPVCFSGFWLASPIIIWANFSKINITRTPVCVFVSFFLINPKASTLKMDNCLVCSTRNSLHSNRVSINIIKFYPEFTTIHCQILCLARKTP